MSDLSEERLRDDLASACNDISEARAEYYGRGRAHLGSDYVKGVAMGYTLALNIIWLRTRNQFGESAAIALGGTS
ncbi:hypothetical protein ACIOD2_32160 [Amycolatopsis sp. NPDC088138]|uniref:hypothetical protein n=1 Tax=Amycolatopsis sp. NPDC088138 TaxID=3363938 RepID=UPI00380D0ED9